MKIYLLQWESTGGLSRCAYTDKSEAQRIADNANVKRNWLRKLFVTARWVVVEKEVVYRELK